MHRRRGLLGPLLRHRQLSTAAPPTPSPFWPQPPPQQTDGVDAAVFAPLWESALDAHVRGQYTEGLAQAKASVEQAAKGKRGSTGREHALRMGHQLMGVSYLRLGRVEEALTSLEAAQEVAMRVSGAGGGDDAYTDLGGVLNDFGIAKALIGDWEGAHKNLSRTLYMAERAYRPDEDLVSAACSNLAEVLCARGAVDEAVEYSEKAARLTDKMEKLSLARKAASSSTKEASPPASSSAGGGGGGCAPFASSSAEDISMVWALPADLLALHERSVRRRLNLGRTLVRYQRPEEAAYYLFQALQDTRASGLRGNPVLYAQCLAAAGTMHLASLLHQGGPTDISHLAAAGCREDNEMNWGAQGLLEKALSVLGPILGDRHPETMACRGNLALLLPLDRGLEVVGKLVGGEGKGAVGRKKASLRGVSSSLSSFPSSFSSPLSLPASLVRNHEALQTLQIAIGRKESQAQCAADLVANKKKKTGEFSSSDRPPEVLWTVHGVLGVGLKGWTVETEKAVDK